MIYLQIQYFVYFQKIKFILLLINKKYKNKLQQTRIWLNIKNNKNYINCYHFHLQVKKDCLMSSRNYYQSSNHHYHSKQPESNNNKESSYYSSNRQRQKDSQKQRYSKYQSTPYQKNDYYNKQEKKQISDQDNRYNKYSLNKYYPRKQTSSYHQQRQKKQENTKYDTKYGEGRDGQRFSNRDNYYYKNSSFNNQHTKYPPPPRQYHQPYERHQQYKKPYQSGSYNKHQGDSHYRDNYSRSYYKPYQQPGYQPLYHRDQKFYQQKKQQDRQRSRNKQYNEKQRQNWSDKFSFNRTYSHNQPRTNSYNDRRQNKYPPREEDKSYKKELSDKQKVIHISKSSDKSHSHQKNSSVRDHSSSKKRQFIDQQPYRQASRPYQNRSTSNNLHQKNELNRQQNNYGGRKDVISIQFKTVNSNIHSNRPSSKQKQLKHKKEKKDRSSKDKDKSDSKKQKSRTKKKQSKRKNSTVSSSSSQSGSSSSSSSSSNSSSSSSSNRSNSSQNSKDSSKRNKRYTSNRQHRQYQNRYNNNYSIRPSTYHYQRDIATSSYSQQNKPYQTYSKNKQQFSQKSQIEQKKEIKNDQKPINSQVNIPTPQKKTYHSQIQKNKQRTNNNEQDINQENVKQKFQLIQQKLNPTIQKSQNKLDKSSFKKSYEINNVQQPRYSNYYNNRQYQNYSNPNFQSAYHGQKTYNQQMPSYYQGPPHKFNPNFRSPYQQRNQFNYSSYSNIPQTNNLQKPNNSKPYDYPGAAVYPNPFYRNSNTKPLDYQNNPTNLNYRTQNNLLQQNIKGIITNNLSAVDDSQITNRKPDISQNNATSNSVNQPYFNKRPQGFYEQNYYQNNQFNNQSNNQQSFLRRTVSQMIPQKRTYSSGVVPQTMQRVNSNDQQSQFRYNPQYINNRLTQQKQEELSSLQQKFKRQSQLKKINALIPCSKTLQLIEKAKQNITVSGINHSFLLLEAFNQMSNLKKETMNQILKNQLTDDFKNYYEVQKTKVFSNLKVLNSYYDESQEQIKNKKQSEQESIKQQNQQELKTIQKMEQENINQNENPKDSKGKDFNQNKNSYLMQTQGFDTKLNTKQNFDTKTKTKTKVFLWKKPQMSQNLRQLKSNIELMRKATQSLAQTSRKMKIKYDKNQ